MMIIYWVLDNIQWISLGIENEGKSWILKMSMMGCGQVALAAFIASSHLCCCSHLAANELILAQYLNHHHQHSPPVQYRYKQITLRSHESSRTFT